MYPNTTKTYSGNITIQNTGAPTGNAVTANSTVTCPLAEGAFDTAAIQVTGTYTGTLTVQVTVDNTNWISLTGAQSLTTVASGVQVANISSASVGMWQLDVSGFTGVRVTALAAVTGTAVVSIIGSAGGGVVGIDTPITLTSGQTVNITPSTVGNPYSLTTTASTNAAYIKSSAGSLLELTISNVTATAAYVKLYNKASTPTVGTDIPIVTFTAPATSATTNYGDQVSIQFGTLGKRFSSGIAIAVTAAAAATDTAAAVAGIQIHGTYL